MNLGQLRTELYARGFDYLGTTRANQYLNDAYGEINDEDLWPYRTATATGAAPLTISDLGVIEDVTDTASNSAVLTYRDRRDLVDAYLDLTTAGTPTYWFIDNGVIRTVPNGGTLSVRYYKSPAEMSADTDTPILPARFHSLIVDVAARKAYFDSDNFDAAAALQAEVDRRYEKMRTALLDGQVQNAELLVGYGEDW